MIGRSRNSKECKATTNQVNLENKSAKKLKLVNDEGTTTFSDEFSEKLRYIYSGDTGNDRETSDIDFVS